MLFGSSFLNTGMTPATFNSSRKYFFRNTFINTACDWYQNFSFLANLIMAGDISLLELFLMSILFICLKTMSVETNSNFNLKKFLSLSLIVFILG